MVISVRAVDTADKSQWSALYANYRSFYKLPEDADSVATTWAWVSGGSHGILGLVAIDDHDTVVGFANLRRFARPSTATLGLYLDDLFTASSSRGAGVAAALLQEAAMIATREGASVVRWITAATNETARGVYDKVAVATPWVTYDMKPAVPSRQPA